MSNYLPTIEKRLDALMSEDHVLSQSMKYSISAGGKRIRPTLALEFCSVCGGNMDDALDIACAIEMVHTYSLIHDDLPVMDNDDFRRGKPTNHKVYGECTATLAGDALQSFAFETILASSAPAEVKSKCGLILARAIGKDGMCYGQYLDMISEGKNLTEDELTEINLHKTGDLIAASCMIGCVCAGADEKTVKAAEQFGHLIGLAFQIRDDMLDVISTNEELGKDIGSDAEENKNTYMVLLGEEGCQKAVHDLSSSAISILKSEFKNTDYLENLVRSMENRRK